MTTYIIQRLLQLGLVLLGASVIVFSLTHLSGDPVLLMLPPDHKPEDYTILKRAFGFDRPVIVQYADFLSRAVRGDFGQSLNFRQPVLDLVFERLPATVELAVAGLLFALLVAVPAGIVAAVARNSLFDRLAMGVALLGQAMPLYWLGLLLILLFSVRLGWLPVSGRETPAHLVLPAVTLGAFFMARFARLTRSAMLDVLGQDFVRTARAKGLTERTVLLRHALKNAAIPLVTMLGLEIGVVIGGAVITESVFAWPGIGRLAAQAIFARDYPLLQGIVLVVATVFVLSNLAVDLVYVWLDPRIKYT